MHGYNARRPETKAATASSTAGTALAMLLFSALFLAATLTGCNSGFVGTGTNDPTGAPRATTQNPGAAGYLDNQRNAEGNPIGEQAPAADGKVPGPSEPAPM